MPAPGARFFLARRARLRAAMATAGLDGLVVSSLPNITYLSGLAASAALALVTAERCWLISDGRYAQALRDRLDALPGLEAREVDGSGSYEQTLVSVIAEAGVSRLGFESAHVSVRRFRWLEAAAGSAVEWVETHEIVERLRAVKDPWEVATLREAAARLSDAAKCILANALAGSTEREVAARVEQELARVGFTRPAFDTIVASGPNAALPHHRAGTRRLMDGDLVVLDFGGVWHGYAVDVSRTRVVGRATARQAGWIEAVIKAQDAAVAAVRPGAAPERVDAAARASLDAAGLGEYFTHGTGHGLGLEVHELPRVGRRRPGVTEPPLLAGMVLTVEPGIYLPGEGGVRIEDDVLVTRGGRELLTDVPRMV
jgi:Xaa-Pro aminopeptidase